MTESEKSYVFDQENGADQMEISGASVNRISAAYDKIKSMKRNYEFKENGRHFLLMENGIVCKLYSKVNFSKQEAEEASSKHVNRAITKYGANNVDFDGCYSKL